MNLWIRSQNRKYFEIANSIEISQNNENVILFSARGASAGNQSTNTTVKLKRGVYFIFLGSSYTFKLANGHTALDLYHIVDVTGNRVWTSGVDNPDWTPL